MAFGQNPGALFIGTLFPDDKAFVASVLKAAKENGYTKVVEPCSGQLAMSCIAADLGYEDIEASDITIFSGALGRYVEGRPIDDMGIKYVETGESPQSAAEVMYEIKHRELLNAAGSVYGDAMLVDFESRKDSILASIHNDMDALKERIPNLTYRDMDMFDHIEAVKDIPGTVILCMCPTYCLHVDEKVLTKDLRWTRAGDVKVGDRLLGFDEETNGKGKRKYRESIVTHAEVKTKRGVRVHLADGTHVDCSYEHPWLVDGGRSGNGRRFVPACDLLKTPKAGKKREHTYALKCFDVWGPDDSRDGGYLAGMYDGEGSIEFRGESAGRRAGGVRLSFTQKRGRVLDEVRRILDERGIKYSVTPKSKEDGCVDIVMSNTVDIIELIGSIRPLRLLDKAPDEFTMRIKERVEIVGVEDIGDIEVMSMTTSTSTYIGSGYAMHNTGGYERFYKAISDSVEWNEPRYSVFEPPAGYQKLLDAVEGSEALLIIYEEVPVGEHVGTPVYGRQGGRVGINMYLVSNRPEEVERLLGTSCSRKKPSKIAPMKYPLMPQGYQLTKKSRVEVVKAGTENIRYYRKLFTHNFTPSQASSGYAMIVDGYLAGIFGYMTMANALGGNVEDVFIGFGMCTKTGYRLNRLLYMVACQRRSIRLEFDDLRMAALKKVKTAMITKYPESKEMRGLMKLQSKEHDKRMGWKLTYGCDIQDKTYRQVMAEFLQKEEQWQKKRQA